MLRVLAVIAGLMCVQFSWAGQLILDNGDTLQGSLKGFMGDDVIWLSDKLGEVKVPKRAVLGMQAAEQMKIPGKDLPCVVQAMINEQVILECEDGDVTRAPLLTLKQVVPYTGHAAATYAFRGMVRASGWRQTGNVESSYGEILSDLELRHGDWRHILRLSTSAQSTVTGVADGVPVTTRTRRGMAAYDLNWFFQPQWYLANRIAAESDDNLNIQEKYTVVSGLGYQVWESERSSLAFELGLQHSRVYRLLNPLESEPEVALSARPLTRFRYNLPASVRFYHTSHYTQPLSDGVEGQPDRREFRSDTGVDFPIGFGVSANVSVEWNIVNFTLDSNPDRSRTDTIYRFGVNYSW